MPDRVLVWAVRALWAVVPFTVWPALAAGLRTDAPAVRATAAVGGWAVWGVVLVTTLVPAPLGLTVQRCVAPALLAASVAAAATAQPSALATGGAVGWSALVVAAMFLPAAATVCVNGPAYPNERRFPLVAPGALLIGPIEVAWALLVVVPTSAILLLADRLWVLGGGLAAVAVPVVLILGRAFHRLSRRWLVFVPAGVVVHDAMSLLHPVLVRRQLIDRVGPGGGGDGVLDLTLGAPGLALELHFVEPIPMVPVRRGALPEEQPVDAVRVAPSRPGQVLAYAAGHRLPVATA